MKLMISSLTLSKNHSFTLTNKDRENKKMSDYSLSSEVSLTK